MSVINTCGHSILPGDKLFVVGDRLVVEYTEGALSNVAKSFLGYSTKFTSPGDTVECVESKYNDSFRNLLPFNASENELSQSKSRIKKQKQKQRQKQLIEAYSWKCTGSVDMTRTMYFMKQVCKRIDHAENMRMLQNQQKHVESPGVVAAGTVDK